MHLYKVLSQAGSIMVLVADNAAYNKLLHVFTKIVLIYIVHAFKEYWG